MINAEKYKTAKERAEAFRLWYIKECSFSDDYVSENDCFDWLELEADSENKEIKKNNGFKKIFKNIICLIFGHDWVDYNEHCYICSRCMAVAPKG